ncbi:MAG TPA: iron-sulfur cluster assembly scaffold protein [Sphingomicrobium sp.]|nr:iron-sulfur cluster assembly scaffold protein [Sphingomicrobium sp.]
MNAPLYTTEILRLAAALPEPARLERVDATAEKRSPTCGSTIAVALTLSADGKVEALSQRVHACAFGQAAATLMARAALGCDRQRAETALAALEAWLAGKRDDPGDWPGVAALAPVRSRQSRHGAVLLPFAALAAALERSR